MSALNNEQREWLREEYPAALPLIEKGWTVDGALNHVQGVCDREVCGGEHGEPGDTGRKFIYDNELCELVPSIPPHDNYNVFRETTDGLGNLGYISDLTDYQLNMTEFWGGDLEEQEKWDEMAITPARMRVVCRQCGEAFDDLTIAYLDHQPGECGSEQGWDIVPEGEA
jgi:hypothetical protein